MHRLGIAIAALALVAVACGGGSGETTAPVAETLPQEPGTDSAGPEDARAAGTQDGWVSTSVAPGIKPVLALDPSGSPAVAYLVEALDGHIAYASAEAGWVEEHIVDGYFYGPIGLAFDPAGVPHVAYHDHQDRQFDQNLGDLALATRSAGEWSVTALADDGHDGWDSTIAIGPDGVVRAAGIDPQQFGRQEGVEYYEVVNDTVQVTAVGSGPIEYEWNVSLAVDPDGQPGLSWFDNNTQDLIFALLVGGVWQIETVVTDGDVGRFSSLAFDRNGRPHLSFIAFDGSRGAEVLYAVKDTGSWAVERVDQLDEVFIDFSGARRITSLAIDGSGVPHIAYSDQAGLHYGVREDSGWSTEPAVVSPDLALGQLVSLALDGSGTPHIAYFESTPGVGQVFYLTTA